jgi:hypothetical protein
MWHSPLCRFWLLRSCFLKRHSPCEGRSTMTDGLHDCRTDSERLFCEGTVLPVIIQQGFLGFIDV